MSYKYLASSAIKAFPTAHRNPSATNVDQTGFRLTEEHLAQLLTGSNYRDKFVKEIGSDGDLFIVLEGHIFETNKTTLLNLFSSEASSAAVGSTIHAYARTKAILGSGNELVRLETEDTTLDVNAGGYKFKGMGFAINPEGAAEYPSIIVLKKGTSSWEVPAESKMNIDTTQILDSGDTGSLPHSIDKKFSTEVADIVEANIGTAYIGSYVGEFSVPNVTTNTANFTSDPDRITTNLGINIGDYKVGGFNQLNPALYLDNTFTDAVTQLPTLHFATNMNGEEFDVRMGMRTFITDPVNEFNHQFRAIQTNFNTSATIFTSGFNAGYPEIRLSYALNGEDGLNLKNWLNGQDAPLYREHDIITCNYHIPYGDSNRYSTINIYARTNFAEDIKTTDGTANIGSHNSGSTELSFRNIYSNKLCLDNRTRSTDSGTIQSSIEFWSRFGRPSGSRPINPTFKIVHEEVGSDYIGEYVGGLSFYTDNSLNSNPHRVMFVGCDVDNPSNPEDCVKVDGFVQATYFNATSDARLKENIKEFKPSKSILDLPIVEFDFRDSKSHHIGCLAQDLQEICPEIVHANSAGYLSIEENKLVYLLIDEVRKLKEEVKALKGE